MILLLGQTQSPSGAPEYLSLLLSQIDTRCFQSAQELYVQTLMPIAISVALGLLPVCFFVEMSFCGFRIMSGESIIRQFTRFLLVSLICYFLIFLQLPQRTLIAAIGQLRDAGKTVGSQIISNQLVQLRLLPSVPAGELIDPVGAWNLWIGLPQMKTGNSLVENPNYKYGYLFIQSCLLRSSIGQPISSASQPSSFQQTKAYYQSLLSSGTPLTPSAPPPSLTASFSDSFFLVLAPMEALSMVQPMSGAMIAGSLTPGFLCAGILGASYYAFFIGLALGTITVPLCFFHSFDKAWQNYLRFCMGLCLVPLFYYLFAAIGFLFSTQIFSILFPAQGPGMGDIIGAVYVDAMSTAISCVVNSPFESVLNQTSGTPPVVHQLSEGLIDWFVLKTLNLFLTLGRMAGGCIIVSAFVTAGTAFPVAACRLAFSWEKGFTDTALLNEVIRAFESISQGVGSGVAASYFTGMNLATSISNNTRGLSGLVGAGQGSLKGFGRGLAGK